MRVYMHLLEVTKQPSTLEYYLSVLYKWLLSSHTARLLYVTCRAHIAHSLTDNYYVHALHVRILDFNLVVKWLMSVYVR